jgi:hypothetical protein
MSDAVVRLLVVGGSAIVVVAAALATRRWQRPTHERVDVAGLALPPGIVIFTSTDCATCKQAIARVRGTGVPVREITWELERAMLERARVAAVPLTLVVGPDGSVLDQIVGVPRRRRLKRATGRLSATGG